MREAFLIKFKSPQIVTRDDFQKFYRAFSAFGNVFKVFVNPTYKSGQVYFETEQDATKAYISLGKENTLDITFNEQPIPTHYRTDFKPKRDPGDTVECEKDCMYDVYGNKLETAISGDGETFVSLSSLEKTGVKLYREEINENFEKGDKAWNEQLHQFLHKQALVFINMTRMVPKKNTIESTITDVINGVIGNNAVNGVNANNAGDGTKRPFQFSKHVEVELKKDHSVKIISGMFNKKLYWGVLVSNLDLIKDIEADMQSACLTANSIAFPSIGLVCGLKVGHLWVRVCITKVDPIECFCIDTGAMQRNIELYQLHQLPQFLMEPPGQAIRIKFDVSETNITTINIGDTILIYPIKKYPDGTLLAREASPPNIVIKVGNSPGNNMKTVTSSPSNASYNKLNTRKSFNYSQRTPNSSDDDRKSSFSKSNHQNGDLKENRSMESLNSNENNEDSKKVDRILNASNTSLENEVTSKPNTALKKAPSLMKDRLNKLKNSSEKSVSVDRKCVSEILEGTQGVVTCIDKTADKVIFFIVPNTQYDNYEKITNIPTDLAAKTSVNVGDFCAVLHEDLYARCIVIKNQSNSYEVALIDYGVLINASKVFELPSNYKDIPEFIVTSKIQDTPSIIEKLEDYEFTSSKNNEFCVEGKTVNCELWNIFEATKETDENKVKKEKQKIIKILQASPKELQVHDAVMLINELNGNFGFRKKDMFTEMSDLLKKINDYKHEPLDHQVEVGEYVLHKGEKEFRRSLVLSINSNSVEVEHVDYNYLATASLEDLFYISVFSDTPSMIKLVKLKGYENKPVSPKARKYIELVLKRKFIVSSVSGNTVEVTFDGKNFSDLIKEAEGPVYKTLKDLKISPLAKGETYEVFPLLDEDEYVTFSISEGDFANTFEELYKALKNADKLEIPLNLHMDEICVAYFEDEWYRAQVVEVVEEGRFLLHFIDFGNVEPVSLNDIRVAPSSCLDIPVVTVQCKLKDKSKLKVEALNTIKVISVLALNKYEAEIP